MTSWPRRRPKYRLWQTKTTPKCSLYHWGKYMIHRVPAWTRWRVLTTAYSMWRNTKLWREHFNILLSPKTSVEAGVSSNIPQLPNRYHIDEPSTAEEFDIAIKRKCRKAAGPDGIPPLRSKLFQLFCNFWSTKAEVPQDFKDATIVTIYKRKNVETIEESHFCQ